MRRLLPALIAFTLALGAVLGWVIISRPSHPAAGISPNAQGQAGSDAAGLKTAKDQTTAEQRAERTFLELDDAERRVEHLRWVETQAWARPDSPMLRKALVSDRDPRVQVAALTVSIALAEKHKQPVDEVIRAGLQVARPEVVQQALREARKHPSAELVPDLIEIADSGAAHRFLAIDALAFTDDDLARAKVVEAAARTDGDKNERIRAIALLAKVKGEAALQLLGQLLGDSDEQVRTVAQEALAARDAR